MISRPLIALLCLFVMAGSALAIERSASSRTTQAAVDAGDTDSVDVESSSEGKSTDADASVLLDSVKSARSGDDEEDASGTDDQEDPATKAAAAKAAKSKSQAAARRAVALVEESAADAEPTLRVKPSIAKPGKAKLTAAKPAARLAATSARTKPAQDDSDVANMGTSKLDTTASTSDETVSDEAAAAKPKDEPAVDEEAEAAAPAIVVSPSKSRKAKAETASLDDAEAPAADEDIAAVTKPAKPAKSKKKATAATAETPEADATPKTGTKAKAAKPVDAAALESHDDSIGAFAVPAKKIEDAEAATKPAVPCEPSVEAPAAPATDPRSTRAKVFANPIAFTSKGQIKAFLVKINRDLHYTFKPVLEGGKVTALNLTMVDRANDNKVTEGVVSIDANGTLVTDEITLTNACNLALIDPATQAKLRDAEGPFKTRGKMEIQGSILQLTLTHRRIGEVTADGSMTVESTSDSDCDRVHTKTVTQLAADGLPTSAETTGTIAKGPINLNVNLKLERQASVSAE